MPNVLKVKKVPLRKCVITNEQHPKMEMFRVVRTPEGNVVVDITGKVRGHGAYVCKKKSTITMAQKKKTLNRHAEESQADHRLRKSPGPHRIRPGALSRSAGLRTGKLQGIHPRQLRPWWCRCGTGSGWCQGYLPPGLGMRPTQCHRHRGGPLRRAPDPALAGYVRQESCFQNRRCRRMRLRGNSRPHRSRQDRCNPADYPPL